MSEKCAEGNILLVRVCSTLENTSKESIEVTGILDFTKMKHALICHPPLFAAFDVISSGSVGNNNLPQLP